MDPAVRGAGTQSGIAGAAAQPWSLIMAIMAAQNVDILEVDDGIAAALLQVLILTSGAAKATQAQLRGSKVGGALHAVPTQSGSLFSTTYRAA